MPIEEQLNPPVAVHGEAVAGRAAAVRRELLKLDSSLEDMSFDLAELLAEVRGAALYGAWGFSTFEDYVSAELNTKLRRAQYLTRIVQVCTACGIERLDYQPAGITKLREITRLNPEGSFWNTETKESEPLKGHIQRLVKAAPQMKQAEVVEEVKRLMGLVGDDAMENRTFSWKRAVIENVIEPAQELARRKMGSAGRDEEGNAIDYSASAAEEVIHQEFLNDPSNYDEEPDESQAQVEGVSWEEITGVGSEQPEPTEEPGEPTPTDNGI